jgi:peptide/nickel transport system permease protein
MLKFILKRVLYFIPTWLAISVVVFQLSQCTSGDPVAIRLQNDEEKGSSNEGLYEQTARQMGYDKPTFYVSITSKAYPDTLYKILRKDQRVALESLINKYGNWDEISAYHHAVKSFLSKNDKNMEYSDIPNPFGTEGPIFENDLQQLLIQSDVGKIQFHIKNLQNFPLTQNFQSAEIQNIGKSFENVIKNPTRSFLFTPKITFNGFDNRYHYWLMRFVKGDFGVSLRDDLPVSKKLANPLSITLVMSLFAILLSYLIAIPLGIYAASKQGTRIERWLTRSIFALYSVPTFWIATLAIVFLTTPQYGLKIFPSAGMADLAPDTSFWAWLRANLGKLILPIFCMSIHLTMVLTRHLQSNMLETLASDYIRTAKAKGTPLRLILIKHAFRNALFPLITIFGQLLPSLITGSFIVEFIFNIPGMGWTVFEAIGNRDWTVVYAVVMLASLMILIGSLLTDVLYQKLNPRVKL